MNTFMARLAQTLKITDVIHLIAVKIVVRMMSNQPGMPAATTATPAGVVLHLQGHKMPILRLQEVGVIQLQDGRGYFLFICASGVCDHPIKAVAFTRTTRNYVLVDERFCSLFCTVHSRHI